jgi:integrase/recombinase XerD
MKCVVDDQVALFRPAAGPLAAYIEGFERWLGKQGYAAYTLRRHVQFAADFSRWLAQNEVQRQRVSSKHTAQYLHARARRVLIRDGDATALIHLLGFLRGEGAIAAEKMRRCRFTPAQRRTQAFEQYLREERALAQATIAYYGAFVRDFLKDRFGSGPAPLRRLRARDVVHFVQRRAPRLGLKRAQMLTTALRSFLRFARYRGDVQLDLAAAVPSVANWSMSAIPRAIASDQVRQLLARFDRRSAAGRRDFAILLLLSRLGLRACEVARLDLEDIDWKAGTVAVHGKGGRTSLARRCRRSDRRLPATRTADRPVPPPVLARPRTQWGPSSRCRGMHRSARDRALRHRCAYLRYTSVSPRPCHRDAASRRLAGRDRRAARAPPSRHHQDLHEGRFAGTAHARRSLAGRCAMNTLRQALDEYLDMRRALGFKLHDAGRALADFVSFMDRHHASHITRPLALAWAKQPSKVGPVEWARRLSWVRIFARHRSATDPRTQIPEPDLLPYRPQRARPYLYSEREIRDLLRAALQLPSDDELQPWTYHCLFGLLSVSGLRVGEARNLELADVDLDAAVLTVRGSKFGKSRLVPLHASTCRVLADYIARREEIWAGRPASSHLFVNRRGNRLDIGQIHRIFYRLSRQIGLRGRTDRHGPRLHDMRHRFATSTLLRWYRTGEDAERRMPILSAYLGHVHCSDTFWYLSAMPELMREAMARLERRWEARS